MSKTTALVVANFGGPRNETEIRSFLEELLTDPDVIRRSWPKWIHNAFFKKIAKRRAVSVAKDYRMIGGGSPLFADTEWVAESLGRQLQMPALAFHRYLPQTHMQFLEAFKDLQAEQIRVFPLFPQFSYTTTGSIARWFSRNIPMEYSCRLEWIRSYATHEAYVESLVSLIREYCFEKDLEESQTVFVFSAHGLPVEYITQGDSYQEECQATFHAVRERFPLAKSVLTYQSKFGRAKWLEPSTEQVCKTPYELLGKKKQIVFVPLSFTSDHIETLFEIEEMYVNPLRALGFSAYRCPALGRRPDWIRAAASVIKGSSVIGNDALIRKTAAHKS